MLRAGLLTPVPYSSSSTYFRSLRKAMHILPPAFGLGPTNEGKTCIIDVFVFVVYLGRVCKRRIQEDRRRLYILGETSARVRNGVLYIFGPNSSFRTRNFRIYHPHNSDPHNLSRTRITSCDSALVFSRYSVLRYAIAQYIFQK